MRGFIAERGVSVGHQSRAMLVKDCLTRELVKKTTKRYMIDK